MGKNLIQQARGVGGPTYRAPSFRYKAHVKYSNKADVGTIVDFIKCQGHSAPLAKIKYDNGEEGYLIAAEGSRVGDTITLSNTASPENGNTLMLKNIPVGASVFNIESKPGDGGKFVRSTAYQQHNRRLRQGAQALRPGQVGTAVQIESGRWNGNGG